MKTEYTYNPGILDLTDPTVLRGNAITRGSRVTVSRKHRPYMLPSCFAVIEDAKGNRQVVFKRALRKCLLHIVR